MSAPSRRPWLLALGLLSVAGAASAGAYSERCRVAAGKVTHCSGGKFSGEIPVAFNPDSQKFERRCRVANGKVTACSGGKFSGELAVAYDPR